MSVQSVEDDELLREFLLECNENLNQLDRDFVALEQKPGDPRLIGAIFRAVHTIKGNSGFFAYQKLEALTHAGETLLSRLRDGAVPNDATTTSALLAMADGVRRILTSIETSASEGDEDHAPLIAELARLVAAPSAPASPAASAETVHASANDETSGPVVLFADPPPDAPTKELAISDSSIRVDVGLLDRVMNLVGELVLARNQILQFGSVSKDAAFVKASQRLNLLTTELQEGVMKTRMQPIGNVWNKFPRLVRDLSHACGKKVNLELEGTETELDRTIIEAIKDPLTHAVRNAVDHGVESPEKRRVSGKPEVATVHLRAYHEGGQVNIEVSDDGGGLDIDRIRARAIQRALVSVDVAARLSDREIGNFIFNAGFSTAESITNVSGRGVGMDVVKTNIEKIGGTVDLSSRPGCGTTLKIKIPLTLAIIPALIVTCADAHAAAAHRFAIPQVNLLELVRLEGAQAQRGIERLHGTTVYRLRGNLLPIVFLNRALDLAIPTKEPDVMNIVVLQADDRQFGLVVDGILDTEEIVVKPLGKELKGINVFAGATIMGDGRVALILDVPGVAQRANVVSASRERSLSDKSTSAQGEAEQRETLLLFRVGKTGRLAIPLGMVARLEEIPTETVERTGERDVVQYRGAILPLISLQRELRQQVDDGAKRDEPLQVVVCNGNGRSVGFVVQQILDVVEQPISARSQTTRDGVLGAIVVQGKVTELLDVHGVIRRADETFFAPSARDAA